MVSSHIKHNIVVVLSIDIKSRCLSTFAYINENISQSTSYRQIKARKSNTSTKDDKPNDHDEMNLMKRITKWSK